MTGNAALGPLLPIEPGQRCLTALPKVVIRLELQQPPSPWQRGFTGLWSSGSFVAT